MNINGKTFDLNRELESKAYSDAGKLLPPKSYNPIYIEAYNLQMRSMAHDTIELGDGYPITDNPVYMAEYNAIMEQKQEDYENNVMSMIDDRYGFETFEQLQDWLDSNFDWRV